jgi:molybdate transport system permease protein
MSPETWSALGITLKVAFTTTLFILPPGLLAALFLARRSFPGKTFLETIFALPLVSPSPPRWATFCSARSDGEAVGPGTLGFDPGILLTWRGAVIAAAAVMAFPLWFEPLEWPSRRSIPAWREWRERWGWDPFRSSSASRCPWRRKDFSPERSWPSAALLGEFGATVIVAGSIPGKTRTLSLAIYQNIQLGKDAEAMRLLFITVLLAFAAVWTVEILTRRASASRSTAREGADA